MTRAKRYGVNGLNVKTLYPSPLDIPRSYAGRVDNCIVTFMIFAYAECLFPRRRREVCCNSRILCCGWCNILCFFYQKMLEDRGNTAVYLLYAYTRIRYFIVTFCGIFKWEFAPGIFLKSFFSHCRAITRNSGVSPESLQEYLQATPALPLDHPKELKLAKKLIQFDEVLLSVLDSLLLHGICDYVYELSTVFTEFYDVCYCIEKDRQTGVYKLRTRSFFLSSISIEWNVKLKDIP